MLYLLNSSFHDVNMHLIRTSKYTHIKVKLKIYLISIKLYYIIYYIYTLYIYLTCTPNTSNIVEFDYSSYNSF